MKKTFVIGAVALAAAAGASAQGLQLYGLIDVSYGKSIIDDINGLKDDIHSGGDNGNSNGNSTTRFGLKGSTDVGSGVKANFNLQSNGITSNGGVNDPFFGRQAWVGLSGGFGEFRVGRQDNVPFQTMIDLDFNAASNGVAAMTYSGAGIYGSALSRQGHSVQYLSPSFGGFTAHLGFQPKGNQGNLGGDAKDADDDRGDKDVFSLGAKYASGPLTVALAYESKRDSTLKDFTSVAASYDFGVAKVMAGYADAGKANSGGRGKGYNFGINVPVGGFNIGANFSKNTDDDVKATAYELWINKEIFKNTIVYLEGGNAEYKVTDPKIKGTGYALGLIYVF